MANYDRFLQWRLSCIKNEDGVIVGSDLSQEWLLPWWWKHYIRHNQYPVAFIDFGMSYEKKEWCRERGELISLRIFEDFVAEKEQIDPKTAAFLEEEFGTHFWICRNVWFKKPIGLLQTPFKRTIWIDLDCEIRASIAPLFPYADSPSGIAMIKDQCDTLADYNYPIYNSGVVPYRREIGIIVDWGKECIEKNHRFRGDQEVFSNMIAQKKIDIAELPEIYNWSRTRKEDSQALILHWHGIYGKYVIRNQINVDELAY